VLFVVYEQGRFKAFPIQQDEHLLMVPRYIERNPLQANLVAGAEDWPWSSLAWLRLPSLVPILDPGPVPRGDDWLKQVQEPATEAEWTRLQESLKRGRPFGGDAWIESTAKKLGLEATLRPVGRPRKKAADKTEEMSPLFGEEE